MISSIRGKVMECNPLYIVLEASGIGYKIFTPPNILSPKMESEYTLFTSLVIRELSHTLYGFETPKSRDLFELLISISGIGPKTALCILSKFNPSTFKQVILENNMNSISSVPGIGKKTAQRLVMDIKDKLSGFSTEGDTPPPSSLTQDAIGALMNLGFNQMTAKKAIEKVLGNQEEQMDLSELITHVLRNN